MLSAERPKGERGATLLRSPLPASFVKNRKELITDHFLNVQIGGPAARSRTVVAQAAHTAGGRAEPPWLVQERREGVCVLVCVQAAGPEPRPDVHARCSSRGAQRMREPRADGCGALPTRRTCPAAGAAGAGMFGTGASGRGAPG